MLASDQKWQEGSGVALTIIVVLAGAVIALLRAWRRAAVRADRAETAARGYQIREEIEDDIQQDIDLAARARRVGLLRPGSK